MIDLYGVKDAARIFGLREARLRYWQQTGFLWPSVRRGGRFFYTFQDLIAIKTAVELLDAGIAIARVRAALDALRSGLPERVPLSARLRVCSDGQQLVVIDDNVAYEPESGQLVMSFCVNALGDQVADVLALRVPPPPLQAVPEPMEEPVTALTEPHTAPSGYKSFLDGRDAEERGELAEAEACYQRAVDLEGSLAAARVNLGNLLHRRGDTAGARTQYEAALAADPDLPEAGFNLGNLLDEMGEIESAIAELRHVCHRHPEFADAHYNLGLMLARIGGLGQARQHLNRYLALDGDSPWALRARSYLEQLRP